MEQIQEVAIDKLSLRPQVRAQANDHSIPGLEASIQSVGLQQPLRVRLEDNELVVVDGERRLHALRRRGCRKVPVIIEERSLGGAEITIRQLVANTQRKGLTPLEIARALQDVMAESGMNAKEVAAACGFSDAFVSKVFKVLESPNEVQAMVASGQLPLSTAYEIAKGADPGRQVELAEEAVNGKLTRQAVQRRVKGMKQNSERAKRSMPPTMLIDLGSGRSIRARGHGLNGAETLIAWILEAVEQIKKALADGGDLSSLDLYRKEVGRPLG